MLALLIDSVPAERLVPPSFTSDMMSGAYRRRNIGVSQAGRSPAGLSGAGRDQGTGSTCCSGTETSKPLSVVHTIA